MKRVLFGLFFLCVVSDSLSQQLRSILINPPGTDNPLEFFEISGTPGSSLSGLCVIYVDGDAPGVIRQKISLSGLTLGSNGLFMWRASTSVLNSSTPANSTSVNTIDFSPDLQNGTGTFILMQCPSQVVGNDIDDLNDGTPNIDITNGGALQIYDAISITDGGATDQQYGAYFSGTNIPVKTGTASTEAEYVFKDSGTWYGSAVLAVGGFVTISSVTNSSWNSSGSTSAFNGLQIANSTSTSSVFPINLINLEIKNIDNFGCNLLWQTTSESNFSHFEVQRSTDAKSFETIGNVKGKGSENEIVEYSFIDEKPFEGLNYYRLKQVDVDNTFEFSKIVSVNVFRDEKLLVYPNPTAEKLKFTNVALEDINSVKIYNFAGKLLYNKHIESLEMDLTGISPQNLLIEINLKDNTSIKRRIVKL